MITAARPSGLPNIGLAEPMRDFKLKDSRRVYEGRVIDVSVETALLPNGAEIKREVVRHPGATAIVPLISPTEVILIKQFRYCAEKELWEIPAGTLEPDETPLECAKRELIEETGYRAGRMTPLAPFYTSPGILTERMHAFVANELTPVGQRLEGDERIVVETVTVQDARRRLLDGDFCDGKTIAVLARHLLGEGA